MTRVPINPGMVDWSGENPGMYLKDRADGPFLSLISYFRVVHSPHGKGHAAVMLLDPYGDGRNPARPNVCLTDNEPLAELSTWRGATVEVFATGLRQPSGIALRGGRLFAGLPGEFTAGRYHSLFALREKLPAALEVTAESDDGIVMAVEHAHLPLAAVQFHPESIMSLEGDVGLRLLRNVVTGLAAGRPSGSAPAPPAPGGAPIPGRTR